MSSFEQTSVYYNTPVEQAIISVGNPWDMKQVINMLSISIKPTVLSRQAAVCKFAEYDVSRKIEHKNFIFINGRLSQTIILSPFKYMYSTPHKKELPDDYIADMGKTHYTSL